MKENKNHRTRFLLIAALIAIAAFIGGTAFAQQNILTSEAAAPTAQVQAYSVQINGVTVDKPWQVLFGDDSAIKALIVFEKNIYWVSKTGDIEPACLSIENDLPTDTGKPWTTIWGDSSDMKGVETMGGVKYLTTTNDIEMACACTCNSGNCAPKTTITITKTTPVPTETSQPGSSPTPTSTNQPGSSPTPTSTNQPGSSPTPTSTNQPGSSPTPTTPPGTPPATSTPATPPATSTPVTPPPTPVTPPPTPVTPPPTPVTPPTAQPQKCNNGVGNGPDCPPPGLDKDGDGVPDKWQGDNDDDKGVKDCGDPGKPCNRGGQKSQTGDQNTTTPGKDDTKTPGKDDTTAPGKQSDTTPGKDDTKAPQGQQPAAPPSNTEPPKGNGGKGPKSK